MKKFSIIMTLIFVVTLLFSQSASYNSADKLIDEMVKLMEKMIAIMKTIHTADDANKKQNEINAINLRVQEISKKIDTIQLSEAESTKLQQKWEARITKATEELQAETEAMTARTSGGAERQEE